MTETQRLAYRKFMFLQLFQSCRLLPNHWQEITDMLRDAVAHVDRGDAVCPGVDGPHWHLLSELERLPDDSSSAAYLCPQCRAIKQRQALSVQPSGDERPGVVYFFYDPATQLTKIGMTANLAVRKRTLESSLQTKLEIRHQIPANAPAIIEKQLHRFFRSKRSRGEWFALTEEDMATIRSTKEWRKDGPKVRVRIGQPE